MRLKLFLFSGLIALLSVSFAYGQSNVTIGVRGGITLPNLTGGNDTPLSTGYSTSMRFGTAVFAEFKITELFSIQPMLEFAEEGAKKSGFQALPADGFINGLSNQIGQGLATAGLPQNVVTGIGTAITNSITPDKQGNRYLYANYNSQAHMNYLMLPVLAKFGWNLDNEKHWRIYVDAGPYVGLLVNAHQIISNSENNTLATIYTGNSTSSASIGQVLQGAFAGLADDPQLGPILGANPELAQQLQQIPNQQASLNSNTSIKDELYKFNWGLEGNVGVQYQINNRNKIFIEGGGNYGLMNIQKYAADGKNHIGAGTVMVGYGYTL